MSGQDDRRYWRSAEERDGRLPPAGPEADAPRDGVDRRRFLQLAGFTIGGSALVGCTRGVEHDVVPYLERPEEVTPGKPYWYASVCGACPAACGILAKARDGRPIKLEGNPQHPVSGGGLCAIGQASTLALYDSQRLRRPLRARLSADWQQVDAEIAEALARIAAAGAQGGAVRFLTDSTTGPTESERIDDFLSRFADGRAVTYDPLSLSAIADAHGKTHGTRVVPSYRFDLADVIVSVGADFLGGWLSPVEHTAAYRANRKAEGHGEHFSYHLQIESRMSLSGSNADRRIALPAGCAANVLAQLVARLAGGDGVSGPLDVAELDAIVERLSHTPRGRTLVVCGDNDPAAQKLANQANELLGNYGNTVDPAQPSRQWRGDDRALFALLDEIEAGAVAALFVRGVNPLYDLPGGERLRAALERVELFVSFAGAEDETAQLADYVCPEPHFLESWGDSEPRAGVAALRQPAIRTIGRTRPLLESLAVWAGAPASAHEILREAWRRRVLPRAAEPDTFDRFWNRTLHEGHARLRVEPSPPPVFQAAAAVTPRDAGAAGDGLRLELHRSAALLDGRHAHNAWLQELPDPVAKTVWDNFAAVSAATAERLGLAAGDVVRLAVEGVAVALPLLIQPGQDDRTVSVALGYGRAGTERFTDVGPQWWEGEPTVADGEFVGANAAPLIERAAGWLRYAGRPVTLEATGARRRPVTTQLHHSLHVPAALSMSGETRRPIVQEATLAAWREDPSAGGHGHHPTASLYPDHPMKPHHWGMAIDLTACTGCSACVIACQAENNIPVVGRDEVGRARDMHWMRIDRYYAGEGADVDVVHMPMMCQHCDNAPCENVCPVQATVQSAEGLNQQVYNRCVGTRYCANNCPYKVRRFNWFDYARDDRLQNLALNPDVTVRSRGVMEKCSLCVQRIQDAKADAKHAGRPLADGEIQPACVQSCPAQAIVFGDQNDPESALSRAKADPRHFTVLAELGVKPVVGYLTLLRNREGGQGGSHHE